MSATNGSQADLSSLRRAVLQADPDKTEAVFALICREGIRLHTVGGDEKADVVDDLREIGLAANLTEETIQAALAAAVDNPFDPEAAKASGTRTEPTALARGIVRRALAELVARRASDIRPEPI